MNINEIAKMAGVSRATVSRYLNDGYVSEEKREKIRAVIEQTGYRPSAQAQRLRTKQTKLIGVVIPKINSDSIGEMVAGIGDVLNRNGFMMVLADTSTQPEEELRYLSLFRDNQVDGVILIGTVLTRKHKALLKDYQVPVVILGQRLAGYSCVYQDDFQAARALTERMLAKAEKIGYIGVTQRDEAAGLARKKGFEEALKRFGRDCPAECRRESAFQIDSAYEQAASLFTENPDIDTVFCATDTIAVGLMIWLRERGISVPGQVQLAGIGDSIMGRVVEPRLATVHFDYRKSGEEAAGILIGHLGTEDAICREVKMGFRIVEGATVRSV